jgi:hypothetical protein
LPKRDTLITMDAFDRLAYQKGWVSQPAPLTKQASVSKKADLAPGESLSENLLKLCSGLRGAGLESAAQEIEQNFLLMKTAEVHLYHVHDEEGEDIIDFAHPDGGKKLDKSWDELGEIETIVERQKKIRQVVEKEPTGKLDAKIAAALMRIKTADTPENDAKAMVDAAVDNINAATTMAVNSTQLPQRGAWRALPVPFVEHYVNTFSDDANNFNSEISSFRTKFDGSPQATFIGEIVRVVQDYIDMVAVAVGPSLQKGGRKTVVLEPEIGGQLSTVLSTSKRALQQAAQLIQGALPIYKDIPKAGPTQKSMIGDIATLRSQLNEIKAKRSDKETADWAAGEDKELSDLDQSIRTTPTSEGAKKLDDLKKHINEAHQYVMSQGK